MKLLRAIVLIVVAAIALLVFTSGSFLVVDRPERADAIIVLAGETDHRPARGVELLSKNYAPKMILDVPAAARMFNVSEIDVAERYVQTLPQPQRVTICRIDGLSTESEALDVRTCLQKAGAHKVLIVTSDYHTRRALSIFRRRLPEFQFSVAAANDPAQFGTPWWKHRQWAKLNFDEWLRLVWWQLVDRWR